MLQIVIAKIKNTILAKANAMGRFSKSNKGTTDLEYKMYTGSVSKLPANRTGQKSASFQKKVTPSIIGPRMANTTQ